MIILVGFPPLNTRSLSKTLSELNNYVSLIVIGLTKRWLIHENAYIDELTDFRSIRLS